MYDIIVVLHTSRKIILTPSASARCAAINCSMCEVACLAVLISWTCSSSICSRLAGLCHASIFDGHQSSDLLLSELSLTEIWCKLLLRHAMQWHFQLSIIYLLILGHVYFTSRVLLCHLCAFTDLQRSCVPACQNHTKLDGGWV